MSEKLSSRIRSEAEFDWAKDAEQDRLFLGWANDAAALEAEIEQLRSVVREVTNAGVTFSDPRLDYVEIQLPDIVLAEAQRLVESALAKEQGK